MAHIDFGAKTENPIISIGYNRQIKMGERYLSGWRGHEAGKVEIPIYFLIPREVNFVSLRKKLPYTEYIESEHGGVIEELKGCVHDGMNR